MTNIRSAFVSGTGTFVDALSGVTVTDTRIRAINCVGTGIVQITGTSTDPFGNTVGARIKFQVNGDTFQEMPDAGVRMAGKVIVSAVSTISTTVYYG